MNRATCLLLFAAFGGAVLRSHVPTLRLEASLEWTENIARSATPTDWRDAMRQEAHAAFGLFHQWTAGLVTTTAATAGFERVPRFTRNDAAQAGLSLHARQKLGWGPYVPVIALETDLSRRAARIDGDDGWTVATALHLSRRLTPAWRLAATTDWQQHYARSSVWDVRHHRFFGTVTWDLTDRLQLSHANGRLWGDFTANASPTVWARALAGGNGPQVGAYYRSVAQAATSAFGPGWITYRVSGRVSFWWLELSPALGRDTSLPLRYESRLAVNQVGVKYRQDLWSVRWLHRF